MPKEVKVKVIGKYDGHEIKPNKAVNLKFTFEYDELLNYIKVHQLINENTSVIVKLVGSKPIALGTFMFDTYTCNKNGECKVRFNSITDHVETNNLNLLSEEPMQPINILLKAEVEETEESEDDEDDGD